MTPEIEAAIWSHFDHIIQATTETDCYCPWLASRAVALRCVTENVIRVRLGQEAKKHYALEWCARSVHAHLLVEGERLAAIFLSGRNPNVRDTVEMLSPDPALAFNGFGKFWNCLEMKSAA